MGTRFEAVSVGDLDAEAVCALRCPAAADMPAPCESPAAPGGDAAESTADPGGAAAESPADPGGAAAESPGGPANAAADGIVRLAVFDFDGTSISGDSPVLLVRHLAKHRLIGKRVLGKIILWGCAYKLRLPQNETWVRGLVFSAFCGKPQAEVDAYLRDFYDSAIDRLFRKKAECAMREHEAQGHTVLIVSATFEPLVIRATEKHPFHHQIATRMAVDEEGNYTCKVEGLPVEGAEKLNAVRRFADEAYGKGRWELSYAYGDHHSDRTLLESATVPFAVNPDKPLLRTARRAGWDILDWDD
jgi:HAD superfamily hydrolase (TIGR01490 family)